MSISISLSMNIHVSMGIKRTRSMSIRVSMKRINIIKIIKRMSTSMNTITSISIKCVVMNMSERVSTNTIDYVYSIN